MFRRFQVHGDSMLPTLRSGQWILASVWPYRWLQPGMVILVAHPLHGLLVKRLMTIEPDRFRLTSDNASAASLGTDDWLNRSCFVGRMLAPFTKTDRTSTG